MQEELGISAELELGAAGTFAVQVNGTTVAERSRWCFPSEHEIVDAVAKALGK